jgi:FtsX-like permease family
VSSWVRRLFPKRPAERDLDAELRFHLEERARAFEASGLNPKEARRRANLALGGLEQVKQECREARTGNHVQDFLLDCRYALRSLGKDRRFALIAVFALALGIGATTVMFSVIYGVVFDPFPYRDFQRSVMFEMWDLTGPHEQEARFHYTIPEFLAIREQNRVFEDIIGNYTLDVFYRIGNVFDQLTGTPHDAYFDVVGVVADFRNRGLLEPPTPEAFLPYSVTGIGDRFIVASTTVDPKSLLPSLQREVWALDSNAAVSRSGSIKNLLAEEVYTRPRFGLITITVFAGMGLVLVLIGIFSVMAYTVALQTHEIGVRMALGAQQGNVLKMVLCKALRLIAVGMLLGVLTSLGLTHFLANQIPGVSARDPLTFLAVVVLFLAVGLIAALLPARRAAGIDVLTALRYE